MATAPLSNLTALWNSIGTTFTAIKMDVTDTASAAGSLLIDLQVGGSSQFSVRKDGIVTLNPALTTGGVINAGNNVFRAIQFGGGSFGSNGIAAIVDGVGVVVRGGNAYNWENGGNNPASGTIDLSLARDAADTLAQRRSTNAQTHRWYRSFTDASNYSRIYLGWSSSTAILATEGAGTGARGNIAFGTAALATSATVGYVMIPSSNGAPTGVPADIPTGQVALHYDTANNKIYVYNGGWVSTAALT